MMFLSNLIKQSAVTIDNTYFIRAFSNTAIPVQTVPAQCPVEKHEKEVAGEQQEYFTQMNIPDLTEEKKEEILSEARKEALKIITDAREYAENLKASASVKLQKEYEDARNKGYKEGIESGKSEGVQKINEALCELQDRISDFDIRMEDLIKKNEQKIKILAVDIARKIINTELDSNSNAFINLYKNAAEEFTNQEWVKLCVSGSELEFATAHADVLKSMVKGAKYIDIVKLDRAPKGTCIVETAQGIANASVDTQLMKVMDVFTNAEQLIQDDDE